MPQLINAPRAVLAGALALLAAALFAGVAQAHPQIVQIDPPPDARLAQPPAQVAMTFNEPLEALSRLELFDAQGRSLAAGGTRDAAGTRLSLDLPALGPGIYTVVWTAAGSDGHVVRGNFAFTVAGPPASAAPAGGPTPAPAPTATPVAAPPAQPPFPTAQALTRWALLAGATGAVGGWLFWLLIALPALGQGGAPERAVARWRAWGLALLLLVLAGSPLQLALYVREIVGRFDPAAVVGASGTRQGQLLLARVGLAGALLALTWAARDGRAIRRGAPFALAAGAALLLTFALAGHAAASDRPALPVALTWLHLAATSAWTGGLLAFALTLGPMLAGRPAGERPALLGALVGRFSAAAMASVAALVLSGAAATLRELRGPADLVQTAYGRALLAKLLLFGVLLAFGAYHLLRARPGLARWGRRPGDPLLGRWPARLARSLRGEAGVALLVLAGAGALTSLPPPAADPGAVAAAAPPTPTAIMVPTVTPGPTRTPVPSEPFDETRVVGDLRLRLAVAPARLGENRFVVTVTDQAGGAVATQLVRLTLSMAEMDMGTNVLEAPGGSGPQFRVTGSPLSMVGRWQIVVLVRRAGRDDVQATFEVPVGE